MTEEWKDCPTIEDVVDAKRRGYSKGYVAGKRRKRLEISLDRERRERQAFLDRAFLAVLPTAMQADNWKFGDKPIVTMDDRIKLASMWAKSALNDRPKV